MFAAIARTVNESVIKTAAENVQTQDCVAKVQQSINLKIIDSQIDISGDFVVRQMAKYALSCIQKSENQSQLVENLQTNIINSVEKLLQESSPNNLLTREQLETIVKPRIQAVAERCIEEQTLGRQGVVEAVGVIIEGSKIRIGCSEEKLDQNAAECIKRSAMGEVNPVACQVLADCAKKEGDFTITSNTELNSACNELYEIALEISIQLAELTNPETKEKSESSTTIPWMMIIWIVLGALLLTIVVALIIYFVNKNKDSSMQYDQS